MFTLWITTRESISETLLGLKSGNVMGHDEIPNEFLKYGGKAILPSLVDLFTAISDFELILSDWQKGILKPLHTYGSLFELDNYRGEVILISGVHKVSSKVIEEKPVSYLREIQGVIRKNRRLEDHVFLLQVYALYKKEKKEHLSRFSSLVESIMVSKVNIGTC